MVVDFNYIMMKFIPFEEATMLSVFENLCISAQQNLALK